MRKTILVSFLMVTGLVASAQVVRLTDVQKQRITEALTRIQMADATVANVLYNGMTFNELQSIFPKTELNIHYDSMFGSEIQYGLQYRNVCYFGTYIIFFSSSNQYINPIVIGFAKQNEPTIYVKNL